GAALRPAGRSRAGPRRRGGRLGRMVGILGGAGAAALAALLVGTMAHRGGDSGTPSPSASPPSASTPAPSAAITLPVADITLYDPPPGDGQEHPKQVGKAADRDPTTVWPTLEYRRNAHFG